MQRPSSVAPASMGPPTAKSSSVRNDKFPPVRGQTPSSRSSTSSRSGRTTCFVCNSVSPYDSTKLIDCHMCKRKFHRGCHRPPVAQHSPPDWTCFYCAPPKTMPPAVKKRRPNRSVFAPAADDDRNRLSLDGREIPESPQEQSNTPNGTKLKSNAFAQPPRFAPFTTEAEKQKSIDSLGSARQVRPPRFAPSAIEAKDDSIHTSTDSNLGIGSKIEKHSTQSSNPSVVISEQASRMPKSKTAMSEHQAEKLQSHELIGMALHDAPDCCLSSEGIQRWIIDNVPGCDSEDTSWKRGVWVTLSISDDFVCLSEKGKTGLWTFSNGSGNKYREWQNPVSTTSSLQDVLESQERIKQGGNASRRNAEALAPDHELDDLTQCDQVISREGFRAETSTNSALPSTIDETLEMIDPTMDDDELTTHSLDTRGPVRSTTGYDSISHLQATGVIPVASHKDRQLSLKRSNDVAFGKPVWGSEMPVWGSKIPVSTRPNSATSLLDGTLKKTSEEIKDNTHSDEKWEAAVQQMGVRVRSPLKAKIDLIRKSRTRSPMIPQKPASFVSQPLAPTSTKDAQPDSDPLKASHGSLPHESDTGVQSNVLLHFDPDTPDIAQESTTAEYLSAGPGTEAAEPVVHMDVDIPEMIEPEPLVPAKTQSDGLRQSHVRQEPLTQEPCPHESPAEEAPAQDLLAEETRRRMYADSAVQTSLPVKSALAMGKITQISLEPRVPAAATTPATVRSTANSTTQIESLPEPQTAARPLPSSPTVQLPTPQAEPIEPQPLEENAHDFENDCLSLLDEMMYPTKPTTPNWPCHYTSVPSPVLDHYVPLSTIQARPTRKQIFGKTELSRIEHNNALTKLNRIPLGAQNVGIIVQGKGYTEEERKREIEANEQEGHYDTLEELFNMPQHVVPFIHEQQLAFRDYAPNALGKIGRPRVIYKTGANAK